MVSHAPPLHDPSNISAYIAKNSTQQKPHLSQSVVIKPNPNLPPESQNLPSPVNPSRLGELLQGYDSNLKKYLK